VVVFYYKNVVSALPDISNNILSLTKVIILKNLGDWHSFILIYISLIEH